MSRDREFDDKRFVPPKETAVDKWQKTASNLVGGVPFIGAPAKVLFDTVFSTPITKKFEDWQDEIGETVRKLVQSFGLSIEELQNKKEFQTAIHYSTQVALRNHQAEKLNSLRNIVMNSALSKTIDDFKQQLFLHYIDICDTWDITILRFIKKIDLDNYIRRSGDEGRRIRTYEEALLYEYKKLNTDVLDIITNRLYDYRLIDSYVRSDGKGYNIAYISQLGRKFLDFISEPKHPADKP